MCFHDSGICIERTSTDDRATPGSWYLPGVTRSTTLTLLASCLLACGPAAEAPREPADGSAVAKTASAARAAALSFPLLDATAASGVDFVHHNGAAGQRHFPETMAPGVALFDADGDGDLDLYAVDGGPWPGAPEDPGAHNRLYANRGDGTFDDVTAASGTGDRGYGMGVAVGDADGDGAPDLYVLAYGPNVLYRNLGEGRFEAVEAGVEDAGWSVGGAFFDFDGDGDLDLFVVNYLRYEVGREPPCTAGELGIYCSPERFAAAGDRLYRNDGTVDGRPRFTEVSRQAGIDQVGRGMGLAVADFDGDGAPDVYVTNDRSANHLYRNQGGRFAEVAGEAGVGYGATGQVEGGMGVAVGDFTGSGAAAIFLTNYQKEPNRFYVAAPGTGGAGGALFFDERTLPSGLGFPSHEVVSWGIGSLDLEGDGDLDLVVANGHVYDNAGSFIPGSAFRMPDQLFVNDGGGRFAARELPGPAFSSRGVATGDLDGDGDAEVVVAGCADRLTVWRNTAGRPERFLLVDLVGRPPNTGAYGARLAARVDGRELRREVTSGGSYASHSDPRIHLGLGDAGRVERLEVRWSDGSVEQLGEVAGGQRVVWRQGEGIVERVALRGVE